MHDPDHHLELSGAPGAPLIHLAPANGFPPECYRSVADRLAPRMRVLGYRPRPLWPGSQPSEVRSWRTMAHDMLTAMTKVSDGPLLGVGHSFGGVLTLYAAVEAPERFRGLVLIEPVLLARHILPLVWLMQRLGQHHRFPLARRASRRTDRFHSLEEARNRLKGRGAFANMTPEAFEHYIESALRPDASGTLRLAWSREWEAQIFATLPTNAWGMLRRLQLPLLLIRGAQSDLIVDTIWNDMARWAPQARFAEIPGGHMIPMEQPAALSKLIAEWADELPR